MWFPSLSSWAVDFFFSSAIGVIGVHPFRQITDLPAAARRPQQDGAKHRSNWCKGSGKWIKGVSNLCLIHFILCNLSSDTLLVHIYSSPRSTMHILSSTPFFPSFAVSYSSCHYLEEGKKQQHPFCTPNWNIGASLAPQISPAGQVVLESTVDMS